MRKLAPILVLLALTLDSTHCCVLADDVAQADLEPINTPWATETQPAFSLKVSMHEGPDPAQEMFEQGQLLYVDGRWEQAIGVLSEFVSKSPEHILIRDGRFLLGEALIQVGRVDEATGQFAELLRGAPSPRQTARATFRLGESAMSRGRHVEARRILRQFKKEFPEHELNAYALPYLAKLEANSGSIQSSRELYQEALRRFPDGPLSNTVRLRLALIQYEQAEYPQAVETLQEIIQSSQDAEHPLVGTACYWLAVSHGQLGELEKAAHLFLVLADEYPHHALAAASAYRAAESFRHAGMHRSAREMYRRVAVDWPESEYADACLLGELRIVQAAGDADEAVKLLAQIRQRSPTSPYDDEAVRLTAETLLNKNQFREAGDLLQPLVKPRGSFGSPQARVAHNTDLYLLALARRGVGDLNQAQRLLSRIRLDQLSADLTGRILIARAETLFGLKRFARALQPLREYRRRFPEGPLRDSVDTKFVVALSETGELDEAKQVYRSLEQREPSTDTLLVAASHLAEAAYRAGDLTTARKLFQYLERDHRTEATAAQALSGLAWADLKLGNHDDALEHFTQFLELYPDDPTAPHAQLAYAQTLKELGRHDEAVSALTTFQKQYPDSPLRAQALLEQARLREQEGDLAQAAEVTDSLLREYPDYGRRDAALFMLGSIQQRKVQPAAAVSSYAELVRDHPSSRYWSDARYRLAQLAVSEGDVAAADQHLRILIEADRDPEVVRHALYLQGRLAALDKQGAAARVPWRRLVREYPDSPLIRMARYGIAESFYQQQQFEKASQLLDDLDREVDTGSREAWVATVRLRRAQLCVAGGQWLEAIQIAETVESDFPDFSQQYEVDYLLGRCCAARGSFSRARTYYERVIGSGQAGELEISCMAEWMIGETYFHQKQYQRAMQAYGALKQPSSFSRWQAAALLQTGKCQEKLGELAKAKKTYAEVVDRYADTSWAERATERLRVAETGQVESLKR